LRRLQVRFRREHLRLRCRDARLGLRHVSARHLAHIETIPRLLELFLQHLNVAPLQIEDRGIAQHVHVGSRPVEQRGLHSITQRLAAGQHLRLGLPRQVASAETVKHGLHEADVAAARTDVRVGARQASGGRQGRRLEMLVAGVELRANAWTVAGERLRDAFVGDAQGGPLRIERWIVAIGLSQRGFERLRGSLPWQADRGRNRCRADRPTHSGPNHLTPYPSRCRAHCSVGCVPGYGNHRGAGCIVKPLARLYRDKSFQWRNAATPARRSSGRQSRSKRNLS
jgi:hypothetical protein